MRIAFLDTVHPFLSEALTKDGHECVGLYTDNYQQIAGVIAGFDGIVIRSRITLDENILTVADKLKFIARAGAGMENIDTVFAAKKNIVCINAPEGNRDAVAEQAIGMLLSLFNNLNRAQQEVREGLWKREANRGHELGGKTVGIIGYGNTGQAFARKLKGFNCRILVFDKYKSGFAEEGIEECSLEKIFNEADILSLHIPLTEESLYWMNEKLIQNFRKNFYLINTSRGKCVRIADLVSAMRSGKITGVCLDVLEYEDLSFEKFDLQQYRVDPDWLYLSSSNQAVLTPHIAGWTFESHEKISRVLYEKIKVLALPV